MVLRAHDTESEEQRDSAERKGPTVTVPFYLSLFLFIFRLSGATRAYSEEYRVRVRAFSTSVRSVV